MTAYVIIFRDRTVDEAALAAYAPAAAAARAGHAVTPVARYGRHEVLEGPETEGVVVLAFPSFEEAQAWYRSPAYQEALKLRLAGADGRAVIVEGVD
ncbi:hypothetical protein CLG96_09115 [Sphingomonas oleivorans]|uniref:DUF1330 domain-containing protein n=1 Tax=Sphingomonas oleivorans TaxID=1735121 RepID=A0A2T5FYG0_9SPHN|nr:DUF1330 domain-containing protein [Sphingomonas oleivorans]PTQ11579.1 hypothetical protein CLG96_09115 [Sphingomonas oleivorans]